MIAVSNTTPLHYLVLIEHSDILPVLYGRVLVPAAVLDELSKPATPEPVRTWVRNMPAWLQLQAPAEAPTGFSKSLDPGEREAISLCLEVEADVLLIDDWAGREEAKRRGLTVVGTLRVLANAAALGLLELAPAIARLRTTNFRTSEKLIQSFLGV